MYRDGNKIILFRTNGFGWGFAEDTRAQKGFIKRTVVIILKISGLIVGIIYFAICLPFKGCILYSARIIQII